MRRSIVVVYAAISLMTGTPQSAAQEKMLPNLQRFVADPLSEDARKRCLERIEAQQKMTGDAVGDILTFRSDQGESLAVALMRSTLQDIELTSPFLCIIDGHGEMRWISGRLRPTSERDYLKYIPASKS